MPHELPYDPASNVGHARAAITWLVLLIGGLAAVMAVPMVNWSGRPTANFEQMINDPCHFVGLDQMLTYAVEQSPAGKNGLKLFAIETDTLTQTNEDSHTVCHATIATSSGEIKYKWHTKTINGQAFLLGQPDIDVPEF